MLPIAVLSGAFPELGKYRLLAMDEVVASFWLFVHHALEAGAEIAKKISAQETR